MRIRLGKSTLLFIFLFSLTQLSGCELLNNSSSNSSITDVPGAVPKNEPLSKSGNKNYVVKGKHYYVLNSSKGYHKTGEASWYGAQFHGKRTSSNEKFNLYAMTAASPELPLPTYVKVKNLQNGKEIIVKVNDRGPFVGNRIMDLSYAAAKKLGFSGRGTTKVDIMALDSESYSKYAANEVSQSLKSKQKPKSIKTTKTVKHSKSKKQKRKQSTVA